MTDSIQAVTVSGAMQDLSRYLDNWPGLSDAVLLYLARRAVRGDSDTLCVALARFPQTEVTTAGRARFTDLHVPGTFNGHSGALVARWYPSARQWYVSSHT